MTSFRERLASGTIVGDGGWGMALVARGLRLGAPPELWTLTRPDTLAEIVRMYVHAGAEVITTNTFGGSPMRLAQHQLDSELEEINGRAVDIALAASEGKAYVSASMGPTGRLLAPLGDADPAEVAAGFEQQARVLAEAGADLFCIETMIDLQEAVLAVRAARAAGPGMPIIATLTFETTPRGAFTVMGASVPAAVAALADAGADAVGANCGQGVEEMVAIARELLASTKLPVVVQPNAGLPTLAQGTLVYPTTPERFAELLAPLAAEGVRLIGGCCGTTPEHIRALRERIG
ncbi:MAG TPA: homocysteine S-methyltransferase family protein [Thermoanaerobaculia bacterium]